MSGVAVTLTTLPGRFAVVRADAGSDIPGWAAGGALWSVTRTPDELSIVCDQERVPDGALAERDWRCLAVEGPLDFSMVGILASLSGALAEAGVSLFALSTYDTDYLLVRSERLEEALTALARAGHRVYRAPGERVI